MILRRCSIFLVGTTPVKTIKQESKVAGVTLAPIAAPARDGGFLGIRGSF